MHTLYSMATVIVILATIFVPQMLALYFSPPVDSESEEGEYDYR